MFTSNCIFGSLYTVAPVLNGHPLFSCYPLLSGQLSKSRKLLPLITIILTSIKRSPLLSGRGHPLHAKSRRAVPVDLTCIKRPLFKRKPLKYYSSYIIQVQIAPQVIGNIDSSEPNWRNTTRDHSLVCEDDEADDEVMTVSAERRLPIFNEREDEYDVELKQATIKSLSEAANMAEQLRDFAQFN